MLQKCLERMKRFLHTEAYEITHLALRIQTIASDTGPKILKLCGYRILLLMQAVKFWNLTVAVANSSNESDPHAKARSMRKKWREQMHGIA